jgi:hypothetical protein
MMFEMRALTEMRELTEAELDHKVSEQGLMHGITNAAMHSHVIGL